tara:strand:+ start:21144 stop:22091 length:948 start_codon:yes stop_codon:yes gene_type:complete
MGFALVLIAGGLVALFLGGELLLRGAVTVSRKLGISELLIGLTIVGFGTSLPELLVSTRASLDGQPGIAIGNAVGSNIANVILIVALAALVRPPEGWSRTVKRDALVMIGASVLLLALAAFGVISRLTGVVLVAALLAYLVLAFLQERSAPPPPVETEQGAGGGNIGIALVSLLGGFAVLFFGAEWLVEGASALARQFGISEAVIGLTIVAVGTSLPELATSVLAAYRGKTDVALGNIVGSNIFNILGILGIAGLIAPIPIADKFVSFDIPVMLGIAVLFGAALVFARRIGRVVAGLMLLAYGSYVAAQFAPVVV